MIIVEWHKYNSNNWKESILGLVFQYSTRLWMIDGLRATVIYGIYRLFLAVEATDIGNYILFLNIWFIRICLYLCSGAGHRMEAGTLDNSSYKGCYFVFCLAVGFNVFSQRNPIFRKNRNLRKQENGC